MSIHTSIKEKVLWITIDREQSLNALDTQHLLELIQAFDLGAKTNEVRCIVVTGKGRSFSVGADIKAMDRMTDEEFAQAADLYQEMCRKTRRLEKPIIAAINGYALGGGLEVALMADIRVCAQSAKLGLPDAELGFSPTGGLTYLLNHLVGAGWAMHLAMTAEIITAQQAQDIGLVTQLVDDDNLLNAASELGNKLSQFPPTGMKNIKRSFNHALEHDLESTLDLESKLDSQCYQSLETRKALKDFIESRKK